ncbi:hypothetical protein CJD36_017845 [Flavipsychrobacter stenotrophus]|uniref:Secretion system C-terminal sorting domain-containing protein n=1 Tax=Flavipsychrobacter stenotrophus TaxID=2077091 RepID=A0A2S7SS95_9BACT|nr:T9SS type A sorting domain-containing protein [Flavipsychrobacter stenotrophus]PQJ09789.1 hypothetical protein CJD36_017845 [Flavipsychrobacter stenotrophus]
MKKVFLLLTIGSIGLAATAQENRSSIMFQSAKMNEKVAHGVLDGKYKTGVKAIAAQHSAAGAAAGTANKTTTVSTQRWYNYADLLDAQTALDLSGNTTGLTAVTIWNDTLGQLNYTSGLAYNTMVSVGSLFMPQAKGFNDVQFFTGEMQLTTEAFQIDSMMLFGLYQFNPAKTAVVDTLTITYTQGSVATASDDIDFGWFSGAGAASLLTGYGLSSSARLSFGMVQYDSVKNTAAGTTAYTFKKTIGSPSSTADFKWGDTTTNGLFAVTFKLPAAFNVNSMNQVGYSISFKSGDASFVPGDTLNGEYNHYRPLYDFVENTAGNTLFAPYDSTDLNSGQFKTLPNYENGWGDVYVPMYAWTSGSNASVLQHNVTAFHVVCASCTKMVNVTEVAKTVSNTTAMPNPASTEVKIGFTLSTPSAVTVELTNTVGQVVATQNVANTTNGAATFNTSNLAAGVYFYTVIANGERTTGRVAIAH